jgi:hypothetical protein
LYLNILRYIPQPTGTRKNIAKRAKCGRMKRYPDLPFHTSFNVVFRFIGLTGICSKSTTPIKWEQPRALGAEAVPFNSFD